MPVNQPPELLTRRLDPKEKLIWWDRPKLGLMLRRSDLFMIPFSIFWAGFAFAWESAVIAGDAPWLLKLWGIPFVVIGVYILFGRFISDAWRRSRMYYGLTEKRAIIATPKSLQSIELSGLTELSLREGGNDRGSITFGRDIASGRGRNGSYHWTEGPSAPTFEGIADAARVYAEIRKLQNKSD